MGRLTSANTSYTFLTARNFTTSYSYDAESNRTGFTDPESGSTTYAYDTLNRMQTLTPPSAFSGTGSFGFTYDAVGNRLSSLGVSPYNVNVSNQLTSTPSTSYTYDSNGNTTSKTDSTGI